MKELGIKNIIIGLFVFAAVIAFMVFSGVVNIGKDDQATVGKVSVWGTIPFRNMQLYIEQTKEQNLSVSYTTKESATYEDELINAFASGTGPDLFMMPHENILRHSDKILEIPYASFPKASYENTYIDQSHLFLTDTGVLAFPVTVDPLVMYYNKALVSSAFLLDVPEYWDEMSDFTRALTVQTGTGEIIISGAALGTFDNVRESKAILTAMILQNSNMIVGTDPITNKKRSVLALDQDELEKTEQALAFYTSFAHFGSNTYSWNEALTDSQNKFIAGELGLYFGRASEVDNIARKNPNLDFNVALFPQVRTNTKKITHGAMMGIAISKHSKNIPAALSVASKIAGSVISDGLATELLVAPARKDLLRNKPDDALRTLVYNSAIISDAWIDPDPTETSIVLRAMIRNINTGASSIQNAISRASADFNTILNHTINTTIPNKQQ